MVSEQNDAYALAPELLVYDPPASVPASATKAEDVFSPFFLHHGDSPAWKRCNHMVISWLLNSISKELAASALYIDTAAAIWPDLKEMFSQTNGPFDKCYKVHGYPTGYKFKNKNHVVHGVANQVEYAHDVANDLAQFSFTKNQYQQLLSLIQPTDEASLPFTGTRTINSQNGSTSGLQEHALANLADIGATNHMVCTIHLLTEITVTVSQFVNLPNGTLAKVTHVGSVKLSNSIVLENVLCVPSFAFNLCDICPMAKLHGLPYVSSEIKSCAPFDLIHADLWDPFSITAIDGSKTFRCLCFAYTLTRNRSKFDSRAIKCIFLGCPYSVEGYKFLDLQTQAIFISRNVVFYEDTFPYKQLPLNNDDPFVLPNPIPEPSFPIFPSHVSPITKNVLPNTSPDHQNNPIPPPENHIASHDINPHLRRSTRIKQTPSYLQRYHCHLAQNFLNRFDQSTSMVFSSLSPSCDIQNYLAYDKLLFSHRAYALNITNMTVPQTFDQAIKDPKWCDAMTKEIKALEDNNTWTIIRLPPVKSPLIVNVFKMKLKADGSLERYKARLVAKGYSQKEGFDYLETFSLVATLTSVRVLLAVAATKDWKRSRNVEIFPRTRGGSV
ncbi:uncharacterized protein LOC111404601 [Olea europaea var. sylvestris]|uniref:uncharacterized protein LOC111404601 n=1 Tax=Olea europaea var. sylvestris TaxID=158386 RepID=UPI000C1CD2A1|nr:uncharacterized protein LOC111404601 [Olea europaea var. sylvestris]